MQRQLLKWRHLTRAQLQIRLTLYPPVLPSYRLLRCCQCVQVPSEPLVGTTLTSFSSQAAKIQTHASASFTQWYSSERGRNPRWNNDCNVVVTICRCHLCKGYTQWCDNRGLLYIERRLPGFARNASAPEREEPVGQRRFASFWHSTRLEASAGPHTHNARPVYCKWHGCIRQFCRRHSKAGWSWARLLLCNLVCILMAATVGSYKSRKGQPRWDRSVWCNAHAVVLQSPNWTLYARPAD